MGDIGRTIRRIELEPIPDDVPVPEVVPETAPAEPVPAGARHETRGQRLARELRGTASVAGMTTDKAMALLRGE